MLIALWRDRTFQSISLTILMVVFSVAGVEAFAIFYPTLEFMGVPLVEVLNPYRAMLAVLYPQTDQLTGVVRASSVVYIGARLTFAAALVAFGTWKLRKWNPGKNEPRELREEGEVEASRRWSKSTRKRPWRRSRSVRPSRSAAGHGGGCRLRTLTGRLPSRRRRPAEASAATVRPGPTTGLHVPRRTHRRIAGSSQAVSPPLDQPDPLARAHDPRLRGQAAHHQGMLCLALRPGHGAVLSIWGTSLENPLRSTLGLIPIGLAILSLILINAQGVTALTSERDTGALDLLLVSELTPKEFIYGKLYGVLYNSQGDDRPAGLDGDRDVRSSGFSSGENLVLFLIDFLLLCHFAAMLGLHAAITYTSSRTAVANSLATIFFLMVGILLCAFLIVLNNQEFARQLLSFMIFIGAGSVALFGSLGARNPSQRHRPGLAPDAVLDVLLHHQPGQRRHHGGVPGQRGHLRLCHPGDAGPGRRRLRHRPGPHQRDSGVTLTGLPMFEDRRIAC